MRVPTRITFVGLVAVASLACGDAEPERPQNPADAQDYLLRETVQPTLEEQTAQAKALREARKAREIAIKAERDVKKVEAAEQEKLAKIDPLHGTKTDFVPVEGIPEEFPKVLVEFGDAELLKAYTGNNGSGLVVVRVGGEIESVTGKIVSTIKADGWNLISELGPAMGRHTSVFQQGKKNAQLTLLDDPDGAILQVFLFELVLDDSEDPPLPS